MIDANTVSNSLREVLAHFDALPDDAVVPSKITAIVLGLSERTVRYHLHLPRVQVAGVRYGQRVGDIRKLCEGMPQAAA